MLCWTPGFTAVPRVVMTNPTTTTTTAAAPEPTSSGTLERFPAAAGVGAGAGPAIGGPACVPGGTCGQG